MSANISSKSKSEMPRIDSYKIYDGYVCVICPYCKGLHTHGDGEGPRLAHCANLPGEKKEEYYLKPSIPAPNWVKERLNGDWRSLAADAMANFQCNRQKYSHRHEFLNELTNAFRTHPEFIADVSKTLSSELDMRVIAEHSVIEGKLRATGHANLHDAALIILREIA